MTFWGLDVFAVGLVFARVAAMVMLLPGFGEAFVPARVRLAFAIMFSILIAPLLAGQMPKEPASVGLAAGYLVTEIAVGLLIGATARVLMSALANAGQIVGLETGLAFAQTTDPTQGQAGQLVSVFLGLLGVTMVFSTGLHHLFLAAILGSYDAFPPAGAFPDLGDAATLMIRAVGDAFRLGIQMAAPLMLAGLIFRIGLGVLSRLIPQIQVFFIAMPVNVLGGFVVFALGLSAGVLIWLDGLERFAGLWM